MYFYCKEYNLRQYEFAILFYIIYNKSEEKDELQNKQKIFTGRSLILIKRKRCWNKRKSCWNKRNKNVNINRHQLYYAVSHKKWIKL